MDLIWNGKRLLVPGGGLHIGWVEPPTPGETMMDYDGNVYDVVTIGSQKWTVQNLRTTHYADGTAIPRIDDIPTWNADTTGAYCENTGISYIVYGYLYNWYAAINVHNLAPSGWRVPSLTDWTNLVTFLGGDTGAGGILKEAGTIHWDSPNTGAVNTYGFTALPAGRRNYFGLYTEAHTTAYMWSTTEYVGPAGFGSNYAMIYNSADTIQSNNSKFMGESIRFMKDV